VHQRAIKRQAGVVQSISHPGEPILHSAGDQVANKTDAPMAKLQQLLTDLVPAGVVVRHDRGHIDIAKSLIDQHERKALRL
jgi:hypothetical protein